jgi:hypothetical protein
MINHSIRRSPIYRLGIILALLLSLAVLFRLGGRIFMSSFAILTNDFGQIWAAGRLNLHGANPYDPAAIQALKNALAQTDHQPLMVSILYSPPWVISPAMAFGALPYLAGRLVWLFLGIASLLVCASLLWRAYGGDPQRRWLAWLGLFSFGPVYLVLSQGQTTVWMLLGLTGFLLLSRDEKKDWLSGACLALATIKPQVIALFWLALLIWVIDQRRWKLIVSTGLVLAAATGISMIFNPRILEQYLQVIQGYSPLAWFTPTFGAFLRLAFGLEKFWLQYVPLVIGIIWLLVYWGKRRQTWDWLETLPAILLASILTSPYAWTYDQVVLLIPLTPAWVSLASAGKSRRLYGWLAIYLIINMSYLVFHRRYTDDAFWWFALAIAFWIVFTRRLFQVQGQPQASESSGEGLPENPEGLRKTL